MRAVVAWVWLEGGLRREKGAIIRPKGKGVRGREDRSLNPCECSDMQQLRVSAWQWRWRNCFELKKRDSYRRRCLDAAVLEGASCSLAINCFRAKPFRDGEDRASAVS